MRLHQHDDFAAFVTAAAAESELSEPFVEKDYWITEILRTVADTLGDRTIFKGGTSLSKGWNLIDRFSEDVDLFVNPAVEPPSEQRVLDSGESAPAPLAIKESQNLMPDARGSRFRLLSQVDSNGSK